MKIPSHSFICTGALLLITVLLSACTKEVISTAKQKEQKQQITEQQNNREDAVKKALPSLMEERRRTKTSVYADLASQPSITNASYLQKNERLNYRLEQEISNENYRAFNDNKNRRVDNQAVSTFSIDVDTASYANVRRLLNQGVLPPLDAVRVEEMINYFSYQYPLANKSQPFSVYTEVGPSPFNQGKKLLHIGIQAKKLKPAQRPATNLVFLLDVSGSMNQANKLGLLKKSLTLLSKQLNENDRVAMVVYAGAAGMVLEPTAGNDYRAINDALLRLSAGGSTNGGAGIELAYQLAQQSFIKNGVNRVILATDGDFNVGTSNERQLKQLIEQKRALGISLTILGFGQGNYNDALMQTLAQNGNGNAYYIDSLQEARKVLVEELSATLVTIAKDVKIQLEFNPAMVSEYRLIGYETRALNKADFNNDKVDAGDIGAGHTVTALYEISLVGDDSAQIDPLRYGKKTTTSIDEQFNTNELAYLRLRYKSPEQNTSELIEVAIKTSSIKNTLSQTSNHYNFAAAVAAFAQLLRGGEQVQAMDFSQVIKLAQQNKGEDGQGYRSEFINMVKLTQALTVEPQALAKTNNH